MKNPYAPPIDDEHEDEREFALGNRSAQFFSVSTSSLAVLYIVTFGLYGVYWFYKQWLVQKRVRQLRISPFARALFAIFFVHRLFELIDQTARATGISTRWKHRQQATAYVLLVIGTRFLGIGGISSVLQSLTWELAALAACVVPLVAAQRVANFANGRTLLDDDEEEADEDEEA